MASLLVANPLSDESVPLQPRPATGELPPLSWAQQRLWFLDQLEPESDAYNLPWSAQLQGALDTDGLQLAVNALVSRHELLRTVFAVREGEPIQLISQQLHVPVRMDDMHGVAAETVQSRLLELIREPFDLHTGPLLRVHVLQLADNEAILLLVMHHIVSDGWSMGVLFKELAALYDGEVQGQAVSLPDLPVQYADYAVWQRSWLSGAELDRQVSYWSKQLKDAPPLLELPLDHPRPPVQRYRGAWINQTFSPELLEGLHALASREGCSLFMVLLAAFKVLLARHTGIEDLVVGTPIAGRRRTELEGLIGFFLNTLALRTDISGNPGFTELLGRVRTTTLDAYEHQELPFEKLLEVLQPVRSTAHTPVVQVMFNLHNEPSSGLSLAGLAVNPFSVDRGTAKFDLSVALVESAAGLQAGFEYNTDLFERDTVELLLEQYSRVLTELVANPVQKVAGFVLVEPYVQQSALPAPGSFSVQTIENSLVQSFASTVDRYSASPAVQVSGQNWSYAELDQRANAVAWQLIDAVGESQQPAQRVGLLMGHDAPMLAALLGVLKAGYSYVPLDPGAPRARLQTVIADAGVKLVVSDPHYAAVLDDCNVAVVAVPAAGREDAPEVSVAPDDLAYILFTSGSTGTPKGVMQTHRNVLHHVRSYTNALHINSKDRLTLLSSYGFDAAVMDIFAALLNGACLSLFDVKEESDLLASVQADKISIFHSTPTVFRLMCAEAVALPQTIRLVVLGGEEAQATDFELFRRTAAKDALFVNGLGPSESTLALQFFADHGARLPGNVVPVGLPVTGTEVLLLNEDGSAAGISGELAIRSRYVSKGYWNQPELTRERFIPDPADPELVLYRTGDKARYLPDGRLVFTGRVDDQVKVRGHRIEPGEVESAATAIEGVERCAVVMHDDCLVAYVVLAEAMQLEISLLRHELQTVLPEYMVPSAFVILEELPLAPNGKLDKKALPAPALMRDEREAYVEPRTKIEMQLVAIWSEVLGVERIGIHDDFFALGGHSLIATRVVARVRDLLGHALPLRALFNQPTVAGLASLLVANPLSDESVPLQPRPATG
ncbi:MAG: amino acid adenylation domain-containing protein, partial [Halieaceae bacterium]|nr:amino acid adenylation domain-containing protein [Halieaceae bacterium]